MEKRSVSELVVDIFWLAMAAAVAAEVLMIFRRSGYL